MVEMYNTAWSAHYGNDGDVKKSPECTLAIVDITPEAKVSTNDCRDVWQSMRCTGVTVICTAVQQNMNCTMMIEMSKTAHWQKQISQQGMNCSTLATAEMYYKALMVHWQLQRHTAEHKLCDNDATDIQESMDCTTLTAEMYGNNVWRRVISKDVTTKHRMSTSDCKRCTVVSCNWMGGRTATQNPLLFTQTLPQTTLQARVVRLTGQACPPSLTALSDHQQVHWTLGRAQATSSASTRPKVWSQ